ncbi:cytochrome P450 [Tricharina praecox]|uniref:cytochrome P450 n=1 Tax=Tricharina praecox TaxID=43433 RepID=UPI00221FC101|nr:cytochrome P450 [Tricharina praecox]KAI5843292.1 cytochrome P450 [Tricharina praecox]
MTKQDFMISDDKPANKKLREEMLVNLYGPKHGLDQIATFYEATILKMIKQKSYQLGGCYEVDAIRDIGNLVHARFASELLDLPPKTQESPHGSFTEQEFYQIGAVLFTWAFLDAEPVASFRLRKAARKATAALTGVLEPLCKAIKHGEPVIALKDAIYENHSPLSNYGKHIIQRMVEGATVAHTVGQIIPMIAASVANQAQGFAQVLDLFLSDEYKHHWRTIQDLARDKIDPEGSLQQLRKYAWEGSRLATAAFGIIREVAVDSAVIQDGPQRTVNLKKGESVFLNFISSGLDPTAFPNPREIDLTRPEELYIQYGYGPHSCIGTPIAITALTAMLRVYGRLENIRRAPRLAGQMKSVTKHGFRTYMTEGWSEWSPFPTTMKIQFDGVVE